MILVVLRCWHLSVVQYDQRLEEAKKPQRRVVHAPAKRATIRDRFNIPLAVNKVQYQATIQYSQLREVPSIAWIKDPDTGKKIRILKRRQYIQDLAQLLANELELDASRLVDLIHSKASLYGHLPFVIKDDISEQEFYRLKMLEKDWYGIHVRRFPKRHYPYDKVAADVIGYMGAINREEYEGVMSEMNTLKEFLTAWEKGEYPELPEGINNYKEAMHRFEDLEEMAYGINDYVGKSGIEGYFEKDLRGFQGKKSYYSDARGNFLRELPGSREPLAGQRLLLTISAELQEFAEELLIKNEQLRHARVSGLNAGDTLKEPWIKGGAIVALDPNNGEVLALASYPRFDPNDFISSGNPIENDKKQSNILRWFETESFIGQVWDQKRPLQREMFDLKAGIIEEDKIMTWDTYLSMVLPEKNSIIHTLQKRNKINDAVLVQHLVDELLELTSEKNIYLLFNILFKEEGTLQHGGRIGAVAKEKLEGKIEKNKLRIKPIMKKLGDILHDIPSNYDKILYIDLCRLAVPGNLFSDELLNKSGGQTLYSYRQASAAMASISVVVKNIAKDIFKNTSFKQWREDNEVAYIKEKRREEKENKKYAKPYIDYIDKKEKSLFKSFWQRHRWQMLTAFLIGEWIESHPDEDLKSYINNLLMWNRELSSGAHSSLPWSGAYHHLRSILKNYNLDIAVQYLQTLRGFNDLERPLLGSYRHLRRKNKICLEKDLASAFYPKYGYGCARSHCYRHAATLGSIFKVVTAYEALVQRFRQMNNPNISMADLNPLEIEDHFYKVGKEEFVGNHKDGKAIPRFYKGGRLPRSLSRNIGNVEIVKAMERSSNPYFALLAGDVLSDPEDLKNAAKLFSYGEKTGLELPLELSGRVPEDLSENRNGLYSLSIGQHSLVVTPIQTAVMLATIANGGKVLKPKMVYLKVGRIPNRDNGDILSQPPFCYQESLSTVGIDFPLFSEATQQSQKSMVVRPPTEIIREVFMPDQVKRILLEGLNRVVARSQQNAIGSLQNLYRQYPEAVRDFLALKGQLVGKTSTAEQMENVGLDLNTGTNKYNHLWFGGISFNSDESPNTFVFKDKYGKPELVVVVYLRYGAYGKDTAPVAAQVIRKWREIRNKREGFSSIL